MGSEVPENAPPDAQVLVDWGEEHAETAGVATVEEEDLFEVTASFADANLLVAGTLGRGDAPPLWQTASLVRSSEVETNAAIQFPQQMNAPPIVHDEDSGELTIRTADAELTLTPDPEATANDADGDGEGEADGDGGSGSDDE